MTPYNFKLIPEALRAAAFGIIVWFVSVLMTFDLDTITDDWQLWVRSLVSGAVVAAATAAFAILTRKGGDA